MNIYDLIDPAVLTGIARLELADEDRAVNQLRLGQWFPNALVDDIDFEYTSGTSHAYTQPMNFRAFDTESPIGSRVGIMRKSGSLPALSEKYLITEFDRIKTRAGRGAGAAADAVMPSVIANIAQGVRAMELRMEIVRASALLTGDATLAENGLTIDVDFGRDAGRMSTVVTAWSDTANGTPMDDEEAVVEVMLDEEGLGASDLVAVMNRTTSRLLKASDQYTSANQSFRQHTTIPTSAVNEVRADHDLPPIIEYNAQLRGVNGTVAKVIPDNKVIYLPVSAPVGNTLYGVGAMADEPEMNLELDQRPGPLAYLMRSLDALKVWTVVDGIGMPLLKDPNVTYCLTTTP